MASKQELAAIAAETVEISKNKGCYKNKFMLYTDHMIYSTPEKL